MLRGKARETYSLNPEKKKELSRLMAATKVPKEFARQPRDMIQELERFKATEFRQLMLYTGPVILKNILPPDQYMHFLYLSIAMHILLDKDDTFRYSMIVFAQKMMMLFVKRGWTGPVAAVAT